MIHTQAEAADLVVIGGGPAGMMCAYQAAKRGVRVTLLEPNEKLGRKLRITGKGRCNLTNNCDIKTVLANIPGDGRFLYSALNRFSPADVMAFFEENGLPLKTERGSRVFPCSDNANDVADTMAKLCRGAGVRIRRTAAKQILAENGAVAGVVTAEGRIDCRATAVCTGGLSYPPHRLKGRGLFLCRGAGTYALTAQTLPCPPGERGRLLRRDAGLFSQKRVPLGL